MPGWLPPLPEAGRHVPGRPARRAGAAGPAVPPVERPLRSRSHAVPSDTGYGTKVLVFWSIRSGWPSGGAARWRQSRRSQTRRPMPMGVAAAALARSRPSE